MTLYDKIESLKGRRCSYHSERIWAQLAYAAKLSSTRDGKYDELIGRVCDYLTKETELSDGITQQAAKEAETMLLPISDEAKSLSVRCIGHAHIDMNWMWGFQETVSVTVDTFRTILDLMDRYKDFTFAQSQASVYRVIEKYAPSMLDEIRARIKEGRWEVTASTWVETDKNMPSGESQCRHILYTKRYLSKLLGIPAESLEIDFEPDTFGHNAATPDICAAGGVKYYYHCRGGDNRFVYRWQGVAGKELLVYCEPKWYNADITSDCLVDVPLFCADQNVTTMLKVYGVGDHGGGPTRRDIERIEDMMSWPVYPSITFGTFTGYFKEIEKAYDTYPVVTGERNFVFTGCYTSQSRIKRANRLAETRLYEAEALSAFATVSGGDNKAEHYFSAWENVLFNHFHDILPGSGVIDTREYALGIFQQSMAYAMTGANEAMRKIGAGINTEKLLPEGSDFPSSGGGAGFATDNASHYAMPQASRGDGKVRAFTLFNTTQYGYDGVTELTVWDWYYNPYHAVFTLDDGTPVKSELVRNGHGYWGHRYHTFAVTAPIAAFGYATVILDCRDNTKGDFAGGYVESPDARIDAMTDDDIILENSKIIAVFDRCTAKLNSLLDKKTGKDYITSGSASFRLIDEATTYNMTAWRVGAYAKITDINSVGKIRITDIRQGSLIKSFVYSVKFGGDSSLEVKVSLSGESDTLVFDTKCDFHEYGKQNTGIPQLNFALFPKRKTETCVYDIPFGEITRRHMKIDVPALSYACDGGLMLITDSKYGYRADGEAISVDLIRGSYDPDPYPEFGIHNMKIGVALPDDNKTTASRFVHPVSFCALTRHEGTLPSSASFISADDFNISAVKCAEDGGIIVRGESDCGSLTFKPKFKANNVCLCDVNENVISVLEPAEGVFTVEVKPHEVVTLLIR